MRSNWLHRARQSASEGSVGMVSLLDECHEPERRGTDDVLATPGCLWSTCGQGRRAEDRSEAPFATPGCPWSTCGQGRRAEDRSEAPLRHARMPLKYLWARFPCRRPVRRPLRHAWMPLEYMWARSPCRKTAEASGRDRSEIGWVMLRQAVMPSIFMKFTWHANPHYRYL